MNTDKLMLEVESWLKEVKFPTKQEHEKALVEKYGHLFLQLYNEFPYFKSIRIDNMQLQSNGNFYCGCYVVISETLNKFNKELKLFFELELSYDDLKAFKYGNEYDCIMAYSNYPLLKAIREKQDVYYNSNTQSPLIVDDNIYLKVLDGVSFGGNFKFDNGEYCHVFTCSQNSYYICISGTDDMSYTRYYATEIEMNDDLNRLVNSQPIDINADLLQQGVRQF